MNIGRCEDCGTRTFVHEVDRRRYCFKHWQDAVAVLYGSQTAFNTTWRANPGATQLLRERLAMTPEERDRAVAHDAAREKYVDPKKR